MQDDFKKSSPPVSNHSEDLLLDFPDTSQQRQPTHIRMKTNSAKPSEPTLKATSPSPQLSIKPAKKLFSRRPLTALVVLAAIFLGSGIYSYLFPPAETIMANRAVNGPTIQAAVTLIDGMAQSSSDGKTWKDLKGEETLRQGDSVRTAKSSRVVLSLDDGSVIRLDSDSKIRLANLHPDNISIWNLAGDVYTRVVTSSRQFSVTVDKETFLARGTAYKTRNTDKIKGVEVYQSKVSTQTDNKEIDEGKQYFIKNPSVELQRTIVDISLEQLTADKFMEWNLGQDKDSDEFKDKLGFLEKLQKEKAAEIPAAAAESAKPAVQTSNNITLHAKGPHLSWNVADIQTNDGFKIISSRTSTTPVYDKDTAFYIGNGKTRSYLWNTKDGITYYVRVCAFRAATNTCDNYSNAVQVSAAHAAPEAPQPGAITLTNNGINLSWTFDGTSPHGFKILVSQSAEPAYPQDSKFFASGTTSTIKELGSGTHYIRVCKYTTDININGGCTDYSNQIVVTR